MHELLTTEQMAEADRRAVSLGVPSLTLMEHAGRAVADEAAKMVAPGARIAVLCGPGNNGGDGFVAARYLRERGYDVRVSCLVPVEQLKGEAAEMTRRWAGPIESLPALQSTRELPPGSRKQWDIPDILQSCDLVVDALFGAGLDRPLDGQAAELVLRLHHAGQDKAPFQVLAVDVPSGLNGNTGRAEGPAVVATRTITFFRKKPGHLLMPGRALCGGSVVVADIGIPSAVLATSASPHSCTQWGEGWGEGPRQAPSREAAPDPNPLPVRTGGGDGDLAVAVYENHPDLWNEQFPWPRLAAHKYTRGHALVVSGPAFQAGAARLAARGALRIGAGLVTVASPPSALLENAAHLNAIMLKPCGSARDLNEILNDKRKNAVLIGPGAGVGEDTRELVLAALQSSSACVLDADALTSFAQLDDDGAGSVGFGFTGATRPSSNHPETLFAAIRVRGGFPYRVVLTPHEGEFERLFPNLSGSKLDRALAAAARSGAVIVLKGPDTVVAVPPEDQHQQAAAAINANAPPTLATAGSGDVLAGFITGLLAQGMPAFEAACAAVWLHGECANRFGPGLIAEDLPEALPSVLRSLLSTTGL